MLIERALDEITKKNKVVVGFDLENDYSQISYCRQNQSMPETVSLVMGEEQYNIPTLLCKKNGVEGEAAWLIGIEALKVAKEGQGVLVEDLVLLAKNNGSVRVGTDSASKDELSAEYLLELFIKKALAILSAYVVTEDIAAVAFTMKNIDTDVMEKIRKISKHIGQRKMEVYFLSREDCFFQYMIHQPQEMWIHDVLLYDYRSDGINSYLLSMNRKTNPVACFIDAAEYPQMKIPDLSDKNETAKAAYFKQLDSVLLEIVRKNCDQKIITSVFLLGESFSKDWCRESLKYMCRGRRVFQGNNLFSKGACYGARERVYPSTLSTSYVYLSEDKLRANIGMTCDRGQVEVYYPILDAGTNWYDAQNTFDVMLVKNNAITLNISPVDGRKTRVARISLEGLKVRGNKTNRVELRFYMEDANAVQIEIKDKGFGEFFPSTGQIWKECLPLEVIT
ncbi:MAG: hypothetical protein K2G51_07605 [Lachnospiraceae bacterium]|nr:hypothetical protein [Lachnospiraceae bacterium]MDE7273887.1 hypothetical protein [Lachnospiraceae bacterium]